MNKVCFEGIYNRGLLEKELRVSDLMHRLLIHTVRLLVPGLFYFYAVSRFSLRENDISVLLS